MRPALMLLTLVALDAHANADAAAACTEITQSSERGRLEQLKDRDLERGLCVASKAAVNAITTKDSMSERRCMAATEALMREFKRRWPDRDPKAVLRTC